MVSTREDMGLEDVAAYARRLRDMGKRVVLTNGCFDLLHIGHVRYLRAARELGDALIVGVNSDESARHLKGPDRPIVAASERAELIASLGCVDAVCVFDAPTAVELVRRIKPQVYAKGGDYRDPDGGLSRLPEAAIAEEHGARVVLLPFSDDRSTTMLIERIRGRPDS